MDASLAARASALFHESPVYWSGIILWLIGFAAYVPAAFGRGRSIVSNTGMALCWLGLALTLLANVALDDSYAAPSLEMPSLDRAYWLRSSTQIWMLWILGGALVVASGLRWLTPRVGWLGLATAMVGVIASWFGDETARHTAIQLGTAVVSAMFVLLAWRSDLLPLEAEPGNYEAELTSLCGSRRRADRMIQEERQRRPGLSRAGAAMAAVTRLRHERDPGPSL